MLKSEWSKPLNPTTKPENQKKRVWSFGGLRVWSMGMGGSRGRPFGSDDEGVPVEREYAAHVDAVENLHRERIVIELMTSDRKLNASREGSK